MTYLLPWGQITAGRPVGLSGVDCECGSDAGCNGCGFVASLSEPFWFGLPLGVWLAGGAVVGLMLAGGGRRR